MDPHPGRATVRADARRSRGRRGEGRAPKRAPKHGHDTRRWGPPFVEGCGDGDLGAACFHSCNRGKRGVTAGFETPEGRALVRRLASHADLVIENVKAGGRKRHGLDPASQRASDPRLVVCSISDFGQNSFCAARAGYVSGREGRRVGNSHANIVPYDAFPTGDGHVIIAAGNNGQFRKLCEVLGRPDLASRVDYAESKGRVAHREALAAELHAFTSAWRCDDLLERLEAVEVPAGPINSVAEVFADPWVEARGLALQLDDPLAAAGSTPGVRSTIVIDGVPQASTRPAPGLGQHGEILADSAWGTGERP